VEKGTGWNVAAAMLLAGLVASACASAKPPRPEAVFFPPAPALPRLQYLTHFTGRKDVESQSSFDRFVVGEKSDRLLDKPYGVAIHDGRLYVCDTNATVTVFDLRAKAFSFLKGAYGAGALRQPVNIHIAADGTKYVSDPMRGQVVAFGPDDDYRRAYGEPGDWKPVDAAVFADRLYVADVKNGLVVVFDLASGQRLSAFGRKGDPSARLDRPTNLAFDREGFLYVTDVGRFQVVKLDREGGFVRVFGRLGDSPGHFARPKGVAVDREGLVYAVDAAFNNVQVFTPSGRLATSFGGPGKDPGTLTLPAKVAIDYDNVSFFRDYVDAGFEPEYLVLVTSQFGPRRVNVFAYGRERGKSYPTEEELRKQLEERRARSRATPASR
jgi:sugar lactone lactonase YvrE